MVAYHFPPQSGSSGAQRTVGFVRYLREFGWEPAVLTVDPRAYEAVDHQLAPPDGVCVHRALAFDASRHFAIGERYPSFLARPDRWTSWRWAGVIRGLAIVRRWKPDVLWSTYPIATAHAIGHAIARITGTPWIADFRDPMAQDGYPADPRTWESFRGIESRAIGRATRTVFTTPSAAETYRHRYPERAERIAVIENGFDEEMFGDSAPADARVVTDERFVLLHSGIVYPSERDPTALIKALAALRDAGRLERHELVIRFRAPVHGALIEILARRHGVEDVIEIAAPLPYREALAEMSRADGLLVLQAANCNEQIPAKIYEYLRAGRPILGLADPSGDTAGALVNAGVTHIAALEDATAIADALRRFVYDVRGGRAPLPDQATVRRASRRERTADLARLLNEAAQR